MYENSDFQNNSQTNDSTGSHLSCSSTSADLSLNQSTHSPLEQNQDFKTIQNFQIDTKETSISDSSYWNPEVFSQRKNVNNSNNRDSLSYFSIAAILSMPQLQKSNKIVVRKRKAPSKIIGSKRLRTIFTQSQLDILEEEFNKQQYMVGTERTHLAESLGLAESQVKIWFQNRRIKWRKGVDDDKSKEFHSGDVIPHVNESLNDSYD